MTDKTPTDLAALSRALDLALTERAGEVLEGVTPGPWVYEYTGIGHTVRQPGAYNAIFTVNHAGNFEQDARFIAWCRESVPALLAQNAALRAERDELAAEVKQADAMLVAEANASLERLTRAEAAEAKVEKLRGALEARVKRLEEAGDRLADTAENGGDLATAVTAWDNTRAALNETATTEERK